MDESLNRDSGLTRNQFLIWLGQEAAPDKPIFNEMSVFVIPGELDVERFHQAFQSMLDEVDALRTRVIREHGRPRAEILDHLRYESPLLDLSAEEDVEDALDAWALSKVDSAIDLAIRPFDSTLVRLASDRYAWVLLCHQILTDATSMSLVFQRVSDHYLRLDGRDAPSHADAPGFADYIKHQFDDAQTVKHRKREAYWKAKLADPPEPVVFYGGRSTPNTASRRQRVEHSLGPDLSAAVRGFATLDGIRCLSAHLSSYSVYCAALVLYLHKLSGQTRIALGSTWHNRPRSFESTVGLFMVQNPFEVEIEPDDTLRTLIKKVQSEALGTMRHLPYAAGNPGGRAYDVTLNYVKVVLGRFGDWPVEHRWYRPGFGDGSMQLQVHDVAGSQELTISIDFSTEVFSDADRAAMFGHYVACLNALIADPDQQIGSVAMLTDAERTRLEQWNDTVREYPHQATVLELIERQAELRPDAVAASDADEQITYAQLLERVRRLSRRLVAAGAGPGVSVGVLLNRSIDLIVGLLGVVGTGGAYVPLDPAFPRDRLEYMLEDSGARLLLTQMRLADSVRSGDRTVVHVDRLDAPLRDETAVVESVQPAPDGLAYILYTSGSTGRPKGVEISHKALANFLWSMADEPGCTADDTLLAVTTLSFDIAGLELYLPLIVGGHVEIASRECAADGRLLRSRLDVGGITMLQATPATWRMLLDAGWTGTTGLKALVGGEALPPELVQPLLDRTASVWNMYGPTETTIWSSTQRISAAATEITVGRPIANTGFHIMDAQLQPVPIGIAGELLVSGDGLARGYHDRPELTAEKFVHIAPLGSGAPVRMYRTGDLARFRRDGQVLHLGRLDHQVKIRGYRIEPGEIADALAGDPRVARAAVIARRDARGEISLFGYVVPADGHRAADIDVDAVRNRAREALPSYMIPAGIAAIDELPLTVNGKIDAKALPEIRTGQHDVVEPATPQEALVAGVVAELVGAQRVSVTGNFFDLGGNSLLAMRLIARLHRETGRDLLVKDVFARQTVRELALLLTEGTTVPTTAVDAILVPLREPIGKRVLFCIHEYNGFASIYSRLLEGIPQQWGVYGLQDPVHGGSDVVIGDFDALVTLYCDAIGSVQPEGPYDVLGWSYGGHIAFGVAQELRRRGLDVATLTVVDAIPTAPGPLRDDESILPPDASAERIVHDSALHDEFLERFLAREARALNLETDDLLELGGQQKRAWAVAGMRSEAMMTQPTAGRFPEPALLVSAVPGKPAENYATQLESMWRPFLPRLRRVDTDVTHRDLLDAHALPQWLPALREFLTERFDHQSAW